MVPDVDDSVAYVAALMLPVKIMLLLVASSTDPAELIPAAPPKLVAPEPLVTPK